MQIERRAFLRAASAAALTLLGPALPRALAGGSAVRYLSACELPDGRFAVAEFDPLGMVVRTMPLPDRGHGFAVSADRTRAVAFARHPRTFGVAFTVGGGEEPVLFSAPDGRHFYGHGVFAAGGSLLLATENDYDDARGVIGIYDATDRYRRIGEFDSHGVGPHELIMTRDGRTVAIANGGIETHPDAGDAKLNLPTMAPSLVFIDAEHGDVRAEHRLDAALHQLSIRHLALDADGLVWFGCQYEGAAADQPPLLGRAGVDAAPLMIGEPGDVRLSLRNYIGSVASSADGQLIAASSPRGGRILLVDLAGRVVATEALADGCGLAPLATPRGFVATSGSGSVVAIGQPGTATLLATDDVAFDNHIGSAILA
ncbi:MAG: DUF1513 domain-containing protein [Bauldia sp.]